MKSKRRGFTKKESESFWASVQRASEYVDSWPDWKKEAYGVKTTSNHSNKKLKRKA